eukprot:UN25909
MEQMLFVNFNAAEWCLMRHIHYCVNQVHENPGQEGYCKRLLRVRIRASVAQLIWQRIMESRWTENGTRSKVWFDREWHEKVLKMNILLAI